MIKIIRILFIPGIVLLAACGAPEQKTEADTGALVHTAGPAVLNDLTGVTAYYECPMKCEGKKYDGPGACVACKMDLEKIEVDTPAGHDETEEGHDHEHHDDESADHSH